MIQTYGDTIHSLVERRNYRGTFMLGFRPVETRYIPQRLLASKYIDHCVGNVAELGAMNRWNEFYERVLGLYNLVSFSTTRLSLTEYSACSCPRWSPTAMAACKFPSTSP